MNCRKCGLLIDKNSNFCPYCGESVVKENRTEYDDPFKNIRMDNTHSGQYQYQQNYSNQNNYKMDLNEVNTVKKNNISIIALILGILAIFLSFVPKVLVLGLGVAIVAFILAVVGLKKASRGLGIASLIITLFTGIISFIITVFMFVGSITITFQNNYETTIKDYLVDAFFCGFNENRIEGYWLDSSDEVLYLDENGNYYIYLDSDELTDNYYYGTYEVEDGLYLNSDEVLYADDNYYYYEINTFSNKTKIDGQVYYETIDLLEHGFTLKLDKENKNNLILVSDDTEIEFERR